MSLEVRAAQEADLDHVVALNEQVQRLNHQMSPHLFKPVIDKDAIRRLFGRLIGSAEDSLLVATHKGAIEGYVWVERQHRPDSEFKFASTRLYVHHIAVSQERHRSGIATALMQKVLHLADAADIGEIRLDCWEGNNIAMAFFDAAGFVTTNRLMTRALDD
jgi:ribosomal protein S18 acetylase RimI-like enzyme